MSNIAEQRNINSQVRCDSRLAGERLYSFHFDKVLDFPIRLLKARGKYIKDKVPRRYRGPTMLHSARALANK